MKVIKSSHINPFGGLNFVINEFNRLKIGDILSGHLPSLPAQCSYSWKDILYSFWSIYFCCGDCIEDLGGNFQRHLGNNRLLNLPSPDRVLDRFKQLALPKILCTTPRGKSTHQFSLNKSLNKLNLDVLKSLGVFENNQLTVDYDNTFIYAKKADAAKTYMRQYGYSPGVAMIGSNIVYIENRNGNSSSKCLQTETFKRMFNLFEQEQIKIDSFRADGASYQLDIINFINDKVDKFYIRACMSPTLAEAIAQIDHWEEVECGAEIQYRGEIKFIPFISAIKRRRDLKPTTYRLIVTKLERKDKQINAFTNEAFLYSAVLTSDYESSMHEVAQIYNQRGTCEKEFDVMKNDFGWNNMPFSKLEQNTVFLLFTAMCRNLYRHIITRFSKKYKHLRPNFRIKKFIFRFITIPAKWIKRSRQHTLKIYGDLHFKT